MMIKATIFKLIGVIIALTFMSLNSAFGQFTLILEDEAEKTKAFEFPSEMQALSYLKDLQKDALASGNFLHSIDNYHLRGDSAFATIYTGHVGDEIILHLEFSEGFSSALKKRAYRMTGKQVEINKLKSLFSETIEYYEDTGYPFARLAFYDQKFEEDTLSLTIDVITGPLMLLDSLVIKSKDNIGRRYLVNYLDLQEGNAYSESKIQSLSTKLKEISFIESQKSPEVLFTKSGADVYLYLNSKKANTFNGILGFQPDNETGEIAITGDIDLKLENALNKGERFNFQWKRLQTETQELSIQFLYPYVINTQIGISTHVDLYRRDTTYSELITGLSLLYLIRGNDHLKILFESKQSNSLAVGVGNLSLADSETKSYGVGLLLNRLDYKINPSKGYQLDFEMALGTKSLKVPDPEDLELELESTMTQFRLGGEANAFIPIGKRNTIRFRSNGGWIKVPELFENEMMRIGGLRTVRGFDESSILASAYVVGTLEYRFLLDETSAAYAFFDQCWYENDGPDKYKKDTPYGFGIGINFQTGPGIFTLTYALGSQFHGPILFRNAKVHFGFVSLF